MYWYWRLKSVFAIYMELSKGIGPKPFLKARRIQNELMIEIPYGYVIITPRHILLNELTARHQRAHGMRKHETRDRKLFRTAPRATKN